MLMLLTLVMAGCADTESRRASSEHARAVAEAREARLASFFAPTGYLSYQVSGRLTTGRHRIGSGPENRIRLPEGPAFAGWLDVGSEQLRVMDPHGRVLARTDRPRDELSKWPVTLPDGTLTVVRIGDYLGWRYQSAQAPASTPFKGFAYFPVDGRWRITAQWRPYLQLQPVLVTTSSGGVLELQSPGEARFVLQGHQGVLRAVLSPTGDGRLMLMFRDRTNGKESFGGGRYLYVPMPVGRTMELDFNQAVNPACVVTPHLVCPIPPPESYLDVAVLAGERDWDPGSQSAG